MSETAIIKIIERAVKKIICTPIKTATAIPNPRAEPIFENPSESSEGVNSGMLNKTRRIKKEPIATAIKANKAFAFNIFLKFFLIRIFLLKILTARSTARFNKVYKTKAARKKASIKIIKDAICWGAISVMNKQWFYVF